MIYFSSNVVRLKLCVKYEFFSLRINKEKTDGTGNVRLTLSCFFSLLCICIDKPNETFVRRFSDAID